MSTLSRKYQDRIGQISKSYLALISESNVVDNRWINGVFTRYERPVLTSDHVPPYWRYEFDPKTNPDLLERMGVNAVFNTGALAWNGKFVLVPRVEGADRKSFFAVAESETGIDHFRFWDYPIEIPETDNPDVNIYDMRLTKHEDGWVYGVFCTERKDPKAPPGDMSSAIAQAGIVRTKDLMNWERLPDLKTESPQQRNVVLHPEYINGKYGFYTRPQDSFIEAGKGGGIAWGICDDITNPVIDEEKIIDPRIYHTIKESKNGAGAPPIKTSAGWVHIAHGVRETAAGLRYVLYAFLCDLDNPDTVIAAPGGYFLAPYGAERVGDVSNVVFCNGVIEGTNGTIYIYYGASDTRTYVATTTIDILMDYLLNTPQDGLRSSISVGQRKALIKKNLLKGFDSQYFSTKGAENE